MPILSLIAAVSIPTVLADVKSIVGSFRYDPVELVRTGKSVVGAATLFVDRHAYRYFFDSEANRRAFLARPEQFEIQLGGGCGKMGSLSGRGNPDRFTVYQGRIFVFASDSCRTQFLSNPTKYLEKDDSPITGSAIEAQRGQELKAKVLDWSGGLKAWNGLKSLVTQVRETVKSGATTYDHRTETALEWPARILRKDRWNDSEYGDLYDGRNGYFLNRTEITPMDPQQVRALERVRNHHLPAVLKAAAGRGFVAYDRGPRPDGRHRLDVYFDRTWVGLDVDAKTGSVHAMEFNGRRQEHGLDRMEFTAFATVDGLKLPTAWTTFFNGKREGERTADQVQYRLSLDGIVFGLPGA